MCYGPNVNLRRWPTPFRASHNGSMADLRQLLDLMRRNVEYNGVGSNVQVEELNWGEAIPVEKNEGIDIVLAADCVYFEVRKRSSLETWTDGPQPAFPLLVKTLCELAPIDKQIEILFCWKKRRKVWFQALLAKLRLILGGQTILPASQTPFR